MRKVLLIITLLTSITAFSQLPLFQKKWDQTVDVSSGWADSSVFTKTQSLNNLEKSILCLTSNVYNSNYLQNSLSFLDSTGILVWQLNSNYNSYNGYMVDFIAKNDTIYILNRIYDNSNATPNWILKVSKYNLQGQFLSEFLLTGDYSANTSPLIWSQQSNIEINSNGEILLLVRIQRNNIGNATINNGQSQIIFPNITSNSGNNTSDVVLFKINSSGIIIDYKIFGQNLGGDYPININIDANDRIFCGFNFSNLQTVVPSSPQVTGKNVVVFDSQLNYLSTIQNVDFSKVGLDNFIYCRTGNSLKKYNYLSNLIWTRNYSDFQDFHVNANAELMISGIWIDSLNVNTSIVGDEYPYDYTQTSFDYYQYYFALYNSSGQLINKGAYSTAGDMEKNGNNIKVLPYIGNSWLTFSCSKWYEYLDSDPLPGNINPEGSNTMVCKIKPYLCNPQLINLGNIIACDSYLRNGQTYTTSGNYTQYYGCDSTIQFQLTIFDTYNPEICAVTADTLSTHNIVVWEKPNLLLSIDSFYVFKELTTNQYSHIASIDVDSLSLFHDYTSNPNTTNFKYKIATKNICGSISQQSLFHNTIHLQHFGNGNFQWTNYTIENTTNPIQSYNFYRDNQGNGNFQLINVIPGNNNSYTDVDFNLYPNAKYRVEAIWLNGQVCSPSKSFNSILSNIKNIGTADINGDTFEMFDIYPNPTFDVINVSSKVLLNSKYILFDESGRILKDGNLDSINTKIGIDDLEIGIYFLQMENIKTIFKIMKVGN